jgi:hypothetical protein
MIPEGPLPSGKAYTDFRFSDIQEAREIMEKRTVIYFEKDLEQPEYQTFLRYAKQLKEALKTIDKRREGLENTLSLAATEEFRTHYVNYVRAYEHETIATLPQREQVHENIQQIIQPFLEQEYHKLERVIEEHLPKLKDKKLQTELWDVYAKSEMLGYNNRKEHIPLENIVRLTNDRVLLMKTRIDGIK